jgi:inorganic pyrophosphatase
MSARSFHPPTVTNLGKLKGKGGNGVVAVIVETTKGSRTKLKYDMKRRCFVVKKVLPEGMTFPFDFGFIPSTMGGDDDPLDVILLLDESVPTGTLVDARLIGVIEAQQSGDGSRPVENDRLLAVGSASVLYEKVRDIADLPPAVVEQIEHFFVSYNEIEGRTFEAKGRHGPKRARHCVRNGRRRFARSK